MNLKNMLKSHTDAMINRRQIKAEADNHHLILFNAKRMTKIHFDYSNAIQQRDYQWHADHYNFHYTWHQTFYHEERAVRLSWVQKKITDQQYTSEQHRLWFKRFDFWTVSR